MKFVFNIVILAYAICLVESFKILVVFTMPARSHYILGNALARGLVEAGHDITFVSPFEDKNPVKNGKYKTIVLTEVESFLKTHAICLVESFKILVVFTMPARSHYILGNALARELAEAGYDITIVSPFDDKNSVKNGKWKTIVLTEVESFLKTGANINMFEFGDTNPFLAIPFMNGIGNAITNLALENKDFKNSLKSGEKFDLVIVEQFVNDALKLLACHYKTPLIMFSTMGTNFWVNSLVGNPAPSSYIPDIDLTYTSDMNFWQRLVNSLMFLTREFNNKYIFFPKQKELVRKHFPSCDGDVDFASNISLFFLNSHESVNSPVPFVPNMINIGGFHVQPPKKLPNDLQDYIDNANEGVVYFSMGSNIKPSDMNQRTKSDIINALGKIKQKVLWKWDEDHLLEKPDNIRIGKWFPQQDILAHPNVKLFITHGGLLSTTETIHYGVPILTIPIFGDQKTNAARAVEGGYALSLSISDITEENFSEALDKLLNDPRYQENAKRRSALMHDRPVKPLDLAIYWVEYVIRHKGAPHLRVAAMNLTWYEYFLVDVILAAAFAGITLLSITYLILKKLCCKSGTIIKLKKN